MSLPALCPAVAIGAAAACATGAVFMPGTILPAVDAAKPPATFSATADKP